MSTLQICYMLDVCKTVWINKSVWKDLMKNRLSRKKKWISELVTYLESQRQWAKLSLFHAAINTHSILALCGPPYASHHELGPGDSAETCYRSLRMNQPLSNLFIHWAVIILWHVRKQTWARSKKTNKQIRMATERKCISNRRRGHNRWGGGIVDRRQLLIAHKNDRLAGTRSADSKKTLQPNPFLEQKTSGP